MASRLLLAFDFDHTIIDANSDLHVKKLAPGGELPQEIEDMYSNDSWTHYMATIFQYLHNTGVRAEDMRKCMNEIPLTAGFKDLLDYTSKQGHECIIISDSNSTFIDFILENYNYRNAFSSIFTNPAEFDSDGCLKIQFYHTQDWCDLSTVNLCKGHILTEHIRQQEVKGHSYSHVLYIGDGSNDLCPALTLSENDYVCPRINFRLWKKINKILSTDSKSEEKLTLKAKVLEWNSGTDILELIKQLE